MATRFRFRLEPPVSYTHLDVYKRQQQAHEIARHAYEEGFASGETEGRTFGESQFKVYAQRLDTHLAELSHTGSLLGQASKDEILALALTIGEYLAGQQIAQSRDAIRPLLDSVLAVSYTHLDVYKRQLPSRTPSSGASHAIRSTPR